MVMPGMRTSGDVPIARAQAPSCYQSGGARVGERPAGATSKWRTSAFTPTRRPAKRIKTALWQVLRDRGDGLGWVTGALECCRVRGAECWARSHSAGSSSRTRPSRWEPSRLPVATQLIRTLASFDGDALTRRSARSCRPSLVSAGIVTTRKSRRNGSRRHRHPQRPRQGGTPADLIGDGKLFRCCSGQRTSRSSPRRSPSLEDCR